jgi:Mg-chelatase subunit ChlD
MVPHLGAASIEPIRRTPRFERMTSTPELEHRRPRVTLHSHAELYVQAADARTQVPDSPFELGVNELRSGLGAAEEERLECWLLVDRSGSVLFDRDEHQQVALAWHFASFDSDRDRIGILGFCGFGDYVNLFEFKTPLKQADRALLLIGDCGGGGTPTAEAVAHATRMLRASDAEHKLVVVVTDAPANDTAQCAQAAREAASVGVRVIGVLKPESRHQRPGANHSAFMTEQFGSDWFQVDSYTQTPHALLEHLARMPGPGLREPHVRRLASERQVPAGQERLVAAAAEALLALGDAPAYELSERTLEASDPRLRAVAHYLRMRREQLATQGDELLAAALEAAGAPERQP